MEKLKRTKGITLIALVITIIVLLILAGVTLVTLFGNSGILTESQEAKKQNKDAIAKEQVQLAWMGCETEYETDCAKGTNREKSTYFEKENLNRNLGIGEVTEVEFQETGKSTVTYKDDDGTIYEFEIENGLVYKMGEKTETTEPKEDQPVTPPIASGYLVDIAEIGDYIDIDIEYTNTEPFNSNSVVGNYAETGMTGWRVLNKTGNGLDGSVTLVSAGIPLDFFHPDKNGSYSATSIQILENLYKEITIVGSQEQGFIKNGFTGGNNLKNIFDSCNYIDTTKNIHALGCSKNAADGTGAKTSAYSPLDEIEAAYETLTGTRKEINDLDSMSYLKTVNMQSTNPSFSAKANDLLGNGFTYWIGGSSYNNGWLWFVDNAGTVSYSDPYRHFSSSRGVVNGWPGDAYGIRPVITLKSGVKVADSNTGDGSNESAAYKISL